MKYPKYRGMEAKYKMLKILSDRVFIISQGNPTISEDLDFVYVKLTSQFPNKRLIYADGLEQIEESDWYEILENEGAKDEFSPTGYEILFAQYNGKIPKLDLSLI